MLFPAPRTLPPIPEIGKYNPIYAIGRHDAKKERLMKRPLVGEGLDVLLVYPKDEYIEGRGHRLCLTTDSPEDVNLHGLHSPRSRFNVKGYVTRNSSEVVSFFGDAGVEISTAGNAGDSLVLDCLESGEDLVITTRDALTELYPEHLKFPPETPKDERVIDPFRNFYRERCGTNELFDVMKLLPPKVNFERLVKDAKAHREFIGWLLEGKK